MSPSLPDPTQSAKELFLAALDLPPEQRPVFVRRACGPDPELSRRVAALLAAHSRADELLDAGMPPRLTRHLREGVRNVARRLGLDPP